MNFYNGCNTSDLNLNNGIEVTDSLEYFSYLIPDSTWMPVRSFGYNENGLTVGDTSQGYMRFFNVNQSDYSYDWNWADEQKSIEMEFNVKETGEILLDGQERRYNIVLFENNNPQMISFFVTILDTVKKKHYTLSLTTEYVDDYKSRICNMKPLLESFKIKN
jgi:hypothetical protein